MTEVEATNTVDMDESNDVDIKPAGKLRGANFRRALLQRIKTIDYPTPQVLQETRLQSWLNTILDLDFERFLTPLRQFISDRERS